MSPGPGSTVASVSSLTTGTPNLESLKQVGDASFVGEDEKSLTIDSQLNIGDLSRDRRRHTLREGQSSMMTDSDKSVDFGMMDWEDEHSAMSMGVDYPNMRVWQTV
jgi:hypothetical protein